MSCGKGIEFCKDIAQKSGASGLDIAFSINPSKPVRTNTILGRKFFKSFGFKRIFTKLDPVESEWEYNPVYGTFESSDKGMLLGSREFLENVDMVKTIDTNMQLEQQNKNVKTKIRNPESGKLMDELVMNDGEVFRWNPVYNLYNRTSNNYQMTFKDLKKLDMEKTFK